MDKTKLAELQKRIQSDSVFHIEQIQGVTTLEDYQRRICKAVYEHERVAIAACHDLGKSFIMAKIVLAFASSFPGSKIITTAPTHLQVQQILWSEIRSGHKRSKFPLGGQLNLTEWKIDDDWFALGFSPQKSAQESEGQGTSSSFQGFHGDHIMVVFDEATGIPPSIWTQAEGLLTSASVKFVAIGNPTSRQSEFFKCFSSPLWHKIYLSCFDSPNLKANGIVDMETLLAEVDFVKTLTESQAQDRTKSYQVVQSKLLSLSWVIGAAIKWGFEHPLFVSKVLGKFPKEDKHVLIGMHLVEAAQRRVKIPSKSIRSIGVDVARFGSDKTVITEIDGSAMKSKRVLTKFDTMEITGEIISMIINSPRRDREIVVIDATGIGSGVVDALKERQRQKVIPGHLIISERHFGSKPTTKDAEKKYFNFKAEIFGKLLESIQTDLVLLDESVYLEELPSIRYRFDSQGRYVIESKDEYKKRTGKDSPDHADSLALANFGRFDTQNVGEFSQNFVQSLSKTSFSGSLGSKDSW